MNEDGTPATNELEVIWDETRATFDFEMEAEGDQAQDEEKRLEALLKVVELRATDPTLEQSLMESGKKLNVGELFSSIIQLTSKNDKIIEDIDPEEQQAMQEEQMMAEQSAQQDATQQDPELANIEAIMQEYNVSENIAMAMREAEQMGADDEEIMSLANRLGQLEAQSV